MAGGHHSSGGDYHRGAMDISDQKSVFSAFTRITDWGSVMIAASVALLTFAFAMGLGWWTGVIVYAVICVAAGAILKMGNAWWVTTAITVGCLGVGGAVTMGLMALGG